MKIQFSSRRLFALGFVLLITTNIIVLLGVASNRSGEPESQIVLTERELRLPYNIRKENSGLELRLTWRALSMNENDLFSSSRTPPAWFNAEKLEELGFKMDSFLNSSGDEKRYKKPIPKEVFIVLEKDGTPYREVVKRAEAALEREEKIFNLNPEDKKLRENFEYAEKRLDRERTSESRLFAIDAGLDPRALREKYGDPTRFLIARGSVQPRYDWDKKKKEVLGYISELSVASIYVPLEHRHPFDAILAENKSKAHDFKSPRFEVELAFGSRLEPWVVSVEPIKQN